MIFLKNFMVSAILSLSLIVFSSYGFAGTQKENTQVKSPFFWKVEKNSQTSYLLGTIHDVVSLDELQCSNKIQNQLVNSDLVFVESDLYSKESKETTETLRQIIQSDNNEFFQSLNPQSQEFLKKHGISDQLNPYGYVVRLKNLCNYGVPSLTDIRLDERVISTAYSLDIPVQEMDPSHEKNRNTIQFYRDSRNAFSQYPKDSLISSINNAIENYSTNCPDPVFTDLREHYKSSTLSDEYFREVYKNYTKKQMEALLLDRNIVWLDKLEEARENYDHIFVAGGTLHFIGPDNLVTLLKNRGYSVTRITCEE